MKLIKTSLFAIAIAGGAFAAFAFSPAPNAENGEKAIFYVDNGVRGDLYNPADPCDETPPLCAQEYENINGSWVATGDPSKMLYGEH